MILSVLHYCPAPWILFVSLFDECILKAALGHRSQRTASEAAEAITLNNINISQARMYKVSVCRLWHSLSADLVTSNCGISLIHPMYTVSINLPLANYFSWHCTLFPMSVTILKDVTKCDWF